ncbi:MAG: NADH-quinone oxidoreductase subunit J [Chloroflexota bacterium]
MPDLSEIPIQQTIFIVMALLTLAGGVGVVASRSLFHSALYLVLSFLGVSGLYILLSAGFLAVVQLMVYVGAVSILILFAIMFSREPMSPAGSRGQANTQWWLGLPIALTLFFAMFGVLASVEWPVKDVAPTQDSVQQLGEAFLGSYLIPFEIVSILLSVALIGAVMLAREKTEAEEASE